MESNPSECWIRLVQIIIWLQSIVDSIIAILSVLLNIDSHFERAIPQTVSVACSGVTWKSMVDGHTQTPFSSTENQWNALCCWHLYLSLYCYFASLTSAQWVIVFAHQNCLNFFFPVYFFFHFFFHFHYNFTFNCIFMSNGFSNLISSLCPVVILLCIQNYYYSIPCKCHKIIMEMIFKKKNIQQSYKQILIKYLCITFDMIIYKQFQILN